MAGIFHLTGREYVMARLEVAAASQLTTRVKASGHYLNRAPRLITKSTIPWSGGGYIKGRIGQEVQRRRGDANSQENVSCSRDIPGPRDLENLHSQNGPAPPHEARIETDDEVPILVTSPILDLGPHLEKQDREPRLAVHLEVASVVAPPVASPPPASTAAVLPAAGRVICNASANFYTNRCGIERVDTEVQAKIGLQSHSTTDREWELVSTAP